MLKDGQRILELLVFYQLNNEPWLINDNFLEPLFITYIFPWLTLLGHWLDMAYPTPPPLGGIF